ncbi:hypothetical protein RHO12_01160 [Orbus sturtevantii]|uniref:toxin VasX n=1 Tax=Orbus sturtevantii TaxID=3074109 RepID=UPI00370D75DD
MKHNQATANQCAADAEGKCAACQRHGLKVFLLRQAIIAKNKTDGSPNGEPIYLELAHYMAQLNFTGRMPDETLSDYQYILRTIRDGYVYVMQQHGTDSASRVIEAYESIDGALRRKNAYSLPGSKPRPLPKACRNLHHSVPAAFIHLDEQQYTEAWIGYSQRPWSKETIDGYLTEQDVTALSRFSHVDLTTFKQDQSAATNNRAVPFADIFGYLGDNNVSPPSKVLEFRFAKDSLPYFDSVDGFNSRQAERTRYASNVHDLYKKDKSVSSSAVVLEDPFAIAEELNGQRAAKLNFFNENLPTAFDDTATEIDFDINKQQQDYQRRAKNMLAMVNPDLQRRFEYYQQPMFKKRVILQLIESYRSGLKNYYDSQISSLIEQQQELYQNNLTSSFQRQDPYSNPAHEKKLTKLRAEKEEKLNSFNERLDSGKITNFEQQSELAFKKVVEYYKQYSLDYFTYVRWLFGSADFVSAYAKNKPSSFNATRFWQREFDFTTETAKISHITDITNILLDISGNEVSLEEDNALWDELLSNPNSIYYVICHANVNGISIDEQNFIDIQTDSLVSWQDVLDKTSEFSAVYELSQEEHNKKDLQEKQLILASNQRQVNAAIEAKQQQLDAINNKIQYLHNRPGANQVEYKQAREERRRIRAEMTDLNNKLQAIESDLSQLSAPSRFDGLKVDSAQNYLADMAIKKHTNLIKHANYQPIKIRWHQLNIMYRLAKFNVYPVELNVNIRRESIESVFAMLTDMHGGFFRQNGFNVEERAFLQQFTVIDDAAPQLGQKHAVTKQCKLHLCFPDERALALFMTFMKTKSKNILSAHELNAFISKQLSNYFGASVAEQQIQSQLAQLRSQQATVQDKLNQANLEKGERVRLQGQAHAMQNEIAQTQAQLTKIEKTARLNALKGIRVSVKSYHLNLKVNALVGILTLFSIKDNIQDWGTPQEKDGEMANRESLFNNISTLALLGVDLATQYHGIKLNMQLLKATRSGSPTAMLEDTIRLNKFLGRSVVYAFALINIVDALTELTSAIQMRDMEDLTYFYQRTIGSGLMAIGAALLLITTPFILAIGAIFLLAGFISVSLSKKYDNFSAIEHWLNRCYFGKQVELKYLQYSAYNEDNDSLAGFGNAINDYLLIANGIETFIAFKPLSELINEHNNRRNVQFYLKIPNFALNSSNEYLKVAIRLFDNDHHTGKKWIDLEYYISADGIRRQPTIAVIDSLPAKSIIDGTDYIVLDDGAPNKAQAEQVAASFNQLPTGYQSAQLGSYQGKPIQTIKGLNIPQNDSHNPGEFSLTVQTVEGTTLISGSELTIAKNIAGTYDFNRIEEYQLIIYYYNRDNVPLIITKNSSNITD